ncbi:MAG TPA: DUF3040 domain-containing protein [Mycobacteriales bacterium]
MPLNDAERAQLEEMERRLAQDHPDMTRAFQAPRSRTRVVVLGAAGVFAVVMITLSVMTGDVLPVLLALPLVAGVAVMARHPDLLTWSPPADPEQGGPAGPRPLA